MHGNILDPQQLNITFLNNDTGVSSLDKTFMDLNFPSIIQQAYPFKFSSAGTSNVYSHDFIDSLNFMYPTGVPMTDLAEHHRAIQVNS